jgi:hypothetical protein
LQFQRFANFFYLIISIITFWPDIWPAGPTANIGPLGFVLLVTAVKEAVEDYNRHKADEKMNGTPVKVLDGETWIDSTWAEVTSQLSTCLQSHTSCVFLATHFFVDQAWTCSQTDEQGASSCGLCVAGVQRASRSSVR